MLSARRIGEVLLIAFSMSSLLLSQSTTAEVSGRVIDPTGAAVPQASISVTNVATGVGREIVTNEQGAYQAPLLPPGNYKISVQKKGFRAVTRSGVTLQVDQSARIDFTLQLGDVADAITVQGEAPLLEQDTSSLGQVINNRTIENIPLN